MTESSKTSSEDSTDSKLEDDWKRLERRLDTANTIAIAILILLFMVGCSPTQQIATAATAISETASSSRDRFAVIEAEAASPSPDLPLIAREAKAGRKEQDSIIKETAGIHRTLPGVEDQVPEWVYSLQYVSIALIVMVGAWVLWHTGIGTLIKRIVGLVPKKNVK